MEQQRQDGDEREKRDEQARLPGKTHGARVSQSILVAAAWPWARGAAAVMTRLCPERAFFCAGALSLDVAGWCFEEVSLPLFGRGIAAIFSIRCMLPGFSTDDNLNFGRALRCGVSG